MEPNFIVIDANKHLHIGNGRYGRVHMLGSAHVIKVLMPQRYILFNLASEEIGSHQPDGLPIEDIVRVKYITLHNDTYFTWGFIKRYIPEEVPYGEFDEQREKLRERNPLLCWDLDTRNIRKDSDGKIIIVDTDARIPGRVWSHESY
jgi:hypothetical protein